MMDYRKISGVERRKIANQLRLDSCRMIAGERSPGITVMKHRIWMYLLAVMILGIGGFFVMF